MSGFAKFRMIASCLLCFNFLHSRICYFIRAHFRLQIVRCDLRGIDKNASFTRKFRIASAAEEERYVRILLRFCSTKLFLVVLHEHFTKRIIQILWFIRNESANGFTEQRQADEIQVLRMTFGPRSKPRKSSFVNTCDN